MAFNSKVLFVVAICLKIISKGQTNHLTTKKTATFWHFIHFWNERVSYFISTNRFYQSLSIMANITYERFTDSPYHQFQIYNYSLYTLRILLNNGFIKMQIGISQIYYCI